MYTCESGSVIATQRFKRLLNSSCIWSSRVSNIYMNVWGYVVASMGIIYWSRDYELFRMRMLLSSQTYLLFQIKQKKLLSFDVHIFVCEMQAYTLSEKLILSLFLRGLEYAFGHKPPQK